MCFLNFLNDNSGVFLVLFSLVVAVSTAIYAFLTWNLVSETRKMRKLQSEPEVCAYLQVSPGWIESIQLVIHNIGLGPALDVEYEITAIPNEELKQSIRQEIIQKFSAVYPKKNGVNYLPPNQKVFPIILSTHTELVGRVEKIEYFDVSITYFNNEKDSYIKNFKINLKEYIDIEQIGEGWLGKITYELTRLNNNLSDISGKLK